ncbi:hypothetical protein ACS0TY_002440 [Phlomoides rotata]
MRRTIAKIPYRASTTSSISAAFSTSSPGGGGRGRGGGGRGRGGGSPFQFTADSPTDSEPNNFKYEGAPPPPHGHGHGRGSSPVLPSFSSFLKNDSKPPPLGRGQAFVPSNSTSLPPPQEESELLSPEPPKPNAKMPLLFVKNEETQNVYTDSEFPSVQDKALPKSIMNVLSGAGRGKPMKPPASQSEKAKENRHLHKQRRAQSPDSDVAAAGKGYTGEHLSNEEKVKKAVGILSRGDPEAGRGAAAAARERGTNESEEEPAGLYLGDPADEEKVARRLGPEMMSKIAEGFEEMKSRVLPSPYDDALLEALDTNLRIECEGEYMMGDFETNPDIDEKPPIALRDALEKMKPFLMAYEGIQSQEEWEEIIEDTMKRVPLIKEIVDYYAGPDRITAKEQHEELERVAKTLPASAPSSVKRFTENAVLSLQSNPGWGFDKKCQFMDKLVWEVSQQYN